MVILKILLLYSEGDFKAAFPNDYEGRSNFVDSVYDALVRLGHDVIKLNADSSMFNNLSKFRNDVELVFNIADEGINLNTQLEPHIPAMLDILNIKYTGSDYICLANCLDKVRTKQIMVANGIRTPKFIFIDHEIDDDNIININDLNYPLIIKPSKEDGSVGIKNDAVVDTKEKLIAKVNYTLRTYKQPVLVEEYIDGNDISVGIIGSNKLIVLPLREIIFKLKEDNYNILSYDSKWIDNSDYDIGTIPRCPAQISDKLKTEIINMAIKAYRLMNVKDYARIDFRVDKNNVPLILEINPNPDISYEGVMHRMADKINLSYDDMIKKILDSAMGNEK